MKFVFGDKQMDFSESEVKDFLKQAKEHGLMTEMPSHHASHEDPEHYLNKAKENIAKLVDDVDFPIETESDAKKIVSHCLKLSSRQADLLYEIIEFAIGMRMAHIAKH